MTSSTIDTGHGTVTIVDPTQNDVDIQSTVRDGTILDVRMEGAEALLRNLIIHGLLSPLDVDMGQALRDTVQELQMQEADGTADLYERALRSHAAMIVYLDYLMTFDVKSLQVLTRLSSVIVPEDVLAEPHAPWGSRVAGILAESGVML